MLGFIKKYKREFLSLEFEGEYLRSFKDESKRKVQLNFPMTVSDLSSVIKLYCSVSRLVHLLDHVVMNTQMLDGQLMLQQIAVLFYATTETILST